MGNHAFQVDIQRTIDNRKKLANNGNLLCWYEKLYSKMFEGVGDISGKTILEIGSGTSPLTLFYPNVITSDVLNLDYLDYVFDCMNVDACDSIEDGSLDIITMTNVLHHVKKPVEFLIKASKKLRSGGLVILAEPYFSVLSTFIYKHIHHEHVDLAISKPELETIVSPLSTANIALPYLLFVVHEEWRLPLMKYYHLSREGFEYFSSVSYMITGGMTMIVPIPNAVFRALFALDCHLAEKWPKAFASFFLLHLTRV